MTSEASPRRPAIPGTVAVLPDGTPVTLVKPDGAKRPTLGTREPAERDEVVRRLRALDAWGVPRAPTRRQPDNAIEQALPQRTRTILYDSLPAAIADLVNGRR